MQADVSSNPDLVTAMVQSVWTGRPGVFIMALRRHAVKEREVIPACCSVILKEPPRTKSMHGLSAKAVDAGCAALGCCSMQTIKAR